MNLISGLLYITCFFTKKKNKKNLYVNILTYTYFEFLINIWKKRKLHMKINKKRDLIYCNNDF